VATVRFSVGRAGLLLASLLQLLACTPHDEPEPKPSPKRVKCAALQRALRSELIEVRGTLMPLADRDSSLAPQVSGRVLRVEVREGDAVSVGQVVARVDDAIAVDSARQADAALASARAETLHATTTLERVQRVFERGIVPKQEVDDSAAKRAAAQAAETEAEAFAHQAHRQIERATLYSPLRGVVLKVFRKPGELVDGTPATPIVEIADPERLELVADAPAQDLLRLSVGASALISYPALPEREFSGRVARVAPAIDRVTGVGTVRVAIDAVPGLTLPIGTFGLAKVQSGTAQAVLLAPARALRNAIGEEGELVSCGSDRRAHVLRVHAGTLRDGALEVRGDLQEGLQVAVDPVLGLEDGEALEIAP
jgi:membrane fusion protein (multidrug efflux system)